MNGSGGGGRHGICTFITPPNLLCHPFVRTTGVKKTNAVGGGGGVGGGGSDIVKCQI